MLRGVYLGVTVGLPQCPWKLVCPSPSAGKGDRPAWLALLTQGRACTAGEPRHWEPQHGENAPEEDEGLCDPES